MYQGMIYAFVGMKQSGKSTACAYIEKKLGNAVRINFKDALVEEVKSGFPDLLEYLAEQYKCTVDELFDTKPPEVRKLLQNYGTNVRRKDDDSYWVNKWLVRQMNKRPEHTTTDDVRFINEAQAVKAAGGILIRINRPDLPDNDMHQSEQEQKQIVCDYEIDCIKGDLEGLYRELDKILEV